MKKLISICTLLVLFAMNNLWAQDIFEPNNDYSNPTSVECGYNYQAYIQELEDNDWYEIQVTQSGYISVDLDLVPGNLDLNLEIYQVINEQLVLIADDDYDNSPNGINLTATAYVEAGTFLILIQDENDNDLNTDEYYSITFYCTPINFEINQTIDLAASIPQDTCFEDNIWGENLNFYDSNYGDDDQDWFEVVITESGKLSAELTSVPSILDMNLEIYQIIDDQAELIADDDYDNAPNGIDLTATAFINAGTYYIHIEDENNNTTIEETYNFCLSFYPNAFEINQTIDLAAPIPQDTCFEDNIWGENVNFFDSDFGDNDRDWFEVVITESGKLSAELTSVPSILDLNLEIYQIINDQAELIADDDYDNAPNGIDLTTTAFINAGTYYIHIEDENNNSTIEETYNFCLSFYPNAFEINQTIDLAAPIPQDTCFEDNIWGENLNFYDSNYGDDDQDWFEVVITESGKLSAELTSVPSILDMNLEIYQIIDGQAELIADDDYDNAPNGIDLTATAFINAGTYYIHIEDENNNTTIEETYNFCLSFYPNAFEINQTIDLAASIPQDTCFEDNIWGENLSFFDSGFGDDDRDWFEVVITESGKLSAELSSVPSILDLNLEIYQIINDQAELIADDDYDNAPNGIDLTTTAFINAGTYFIHIEDENNNSTIEETYNFCLSFYPNAFEINQTIDLAAPIPQDTCFENNIWGENLNFFDSGFGDDDRDWFELVVDSACMFEISLTNVPAVLDLNLEIYQIIDGEPVLVTDDGIPNSSAGQELFADFEAAVGIYYIYIEDENNNTTTDETFTVCVECEIIISTIEINQAKVNVFPNPTNGFLSVTGLENGTEYFIFDMSGKMIVHNTLETNEINISHLNTGIYSLSFIDDKAVVTIRVVKR